MCSQLSGTSFIICNGINKSQLFPLFVFIIKHNYMQPDCTLFDAKWERIIFPVVQCNNMLSLAVNENHN